MRASKTRRPESRIGWCILPILESGRLVYFITAKRTTFQKQNAFFYVAGRCCEGIQGASVRIVHTMSVSKENWIYCEPSSRMPVFRKRRSSSMTCVRSLRANLWTTGILPVANLVEETCSCPRNLNQNPSIGFSPISLESLHQFRQENYAHLNGYFQLLPRMEFVSEKISFLPFSLTHLPFQIERDWYKLAFFPSDLAESYW